MAKERIGKFERWILIHCYLKTVTGELPSAEGAYRRALGVYARGGLIDIAQYPYYTCLIHD
jgi:hypothetical protein